MQLRRVTLTVGLTTVFVPVISKRGRYRALTREPALDGGVGLLKSDAAASSSSAGVQHAVATVWYG